MKMGHNLQEWQCKRTRLGGKPTISNMIGKLSPVPRSDVNCQVRYSWQRDDKRCSWKLKASLVCKKLRHCSSSVAYQLCKFVWVPKVSQVSQTIQVTTPIPSLLRKCFRLWWRSCGPMPQLLGLQAGTTPSSWQWSCKSKLQQTCWCSKAPTLGQICKTVTGV